MPPFPGSIVCAAMVLCASTLPTAGVADTKFRMVMMPKLVGIDYLSIDKFKSEKHPTHFVLLTRNIVILEGLNLANVRAGRYRLVALPLKLQDADGAPTRVILMDEK